MRSKFGNVKTVIDGITFDSKKEANRYAELRLLEKAGEISGLTLQPSFAIEINRVKVCTYKADFQYQRHRTGVSAYWSDEEKQTGGTKVVEDVKGMKTPVYNLKKRLMKACHGIEIQEI